MYKLYRDATGDYRWRYLKNGRIIADSGEGYRNKADCLRGIEIMRRSGDDSIDE